MVLCTLFPFLSACGSATVPLFLVSHTSMDGGVKALHVSESCADTSAFFFLYLAKLVFLIVHECVRACVFLFELVDRVHRHVFLPICRFFVFVQPLYTFVTCGGIVTVSCFPFPVPSLVHYQARSNNQHTTYFSRRDALDSEQHLRENKDRGALLTLPCHPRFFLLFVKAHCRPQCQ